MHSFLRSTRLRLWRRAVLTCSLLAIGSLAALAQTPTSLSNYIYRTGTGTLTDMSSGTTQIVPTGQDDYSSGATNIGFTFNFGGNNYTQFSATSNGLMGLTSTSSSVTSAYINSLASSGSTALPTLAPLWDDEYTRSGGTGVTYKLTGASGNYVLVVDWDVYSLSCGSSTTAHFQVRLYQATNKIEYVYGAIVNCSSWSASIGASLGSSNFASITPSPYAVSFSSANDAISTPPANGVMYTISPCNDQAVITGNTSQGGTAAMNNGDVLLTGKTAQKNGSATYQPFSISNPSNGCFNQTTSYQITGTNAGDYSITPGTTVTPGGAAQTPTITFSPSGIGPRTATLTVTNTPAGGGTPTVTTYTLNASGTTRMQLTGNIPQGGTAGMVPGDTLMRNITVTRGSFGDFTPVTATNSNPAPGQVPPLTVTFTIDSAGLPSTEYSIQGASTAILNGGQSFTPVIRFTARGAGFQSATLHVTNSDGETRNYTLFAFSQAPQGTFTINGVTPGVGSNPIFTKTTTCVGVVNTALPLVITNTGNVDIHINSVDVYRVDTTYQQGTPNPPLVRDAQGRPIRANDYTITQDSGRAPLTANPALTYPYTIPAGQTRTLWVNYVGQQPGKRFDRAFIRTDAVNFSNLDSNFYNGTTIQPTSTLGLLSFDLLGNAFGAGLAKDSSGLKLKPLVFPDVRVGDTITRSFSIANSGACDLRIGRKNFRIFSGDVNEFQIVSAFPRATIDPVTNDYVLTAGITDSITIRFIPTRSGTRLATLWLQTNDSTIQIPGLTERGSYYLDMTGRGKATLDANGLVLDPVVIPNFSEGNVSFFNSSNNVIQIDNIVFTGADAAQFGAGSTPFPALPAMIQPGQKLVLNVRMTPVGAAGSRRANIVLITNTGDSIPVSIKGDAGTRTYTVSPSSLFNGISISVGQFYRQTVQITNTGTLPIHLNQPMLMGADSLEYKLGMMPRLDLDAGQTEYLEVTYAPTRIATTTARIDFSDGNGNNQSVSLNGSAFKTVKTPDPNNNIAIGVTGGSINTGNSMHAPNLSVSGVVTENTVDGVSLYQSTPNPANDVAAIVYNLSKTSTISLELFDVRGQLVKTLEAGSMAAGKHTVSVNVNGLASGIYHYRLTVNGNAMTRSMNIVR